MPLLSLDGLCLAFGRRTIFEEDNLAVERGDRLGIVGPNGTGKTTLFRILADEMTPDSGRVVRAKGCRIGYLAQEIGGEPMPGSLLSCILETAPGREVIEARLEEVQAALESSADTEEQIQLSEELAELHSELADLDQTFGPHQAKRILIGLGFAQDDFERPLAQFSGGWRMRAHLASLLYQRPDVLLLDEPTNHLDMPSVNWLSSFIGGFKHAVVLTCHDKEFLNRHIKRVASLEVEGIRTFRGNYDRYLEQRALDLEYLEARIAKNEQRKKELEAFVERFKAKATKARQAQSRVRMIEKLEEQHEELPQLRRSISIRFEPVPRAAEWVIRTSELGFAFHPDRPLFDGLQLAVRRGERIAIVGKNGAGKTTLLKLLASELTADRGAIELGQHVELSYFAQHHAESLDPSKTVLEQVWEIAPDYSETRVRDLCGAFLFSGDDVQKAVGVLSGGEKTRVALARILLRPGNVLLLDEPTNHLDTQSAEKLTDSLATYDGTLIFVSHNLDFARRLSTTVWNVRDGMVEVLPGSLADYLERLTKEQTEREAELGGKKPAVSADKAARIEAREKQAEKQRKLNAMVKKVEEAEKAVAKLEQEQASLEGELADPATHADLDRSKQLAARYQKVQAELTAALDRWTDLSAKLEASGKT
jgi:ATP-binding cassette, subfamily F, member 3